MITIPNGTTLPDETGMSWGPTRGPAERPI